MPQQPLTTHAGSSVKIHRFSHAQLLREHQRTQLVCSYPGTQSPVWQQRNVLGAMNHTTHWHIGPNWSIMVSYPWGP